MRYQVALSWVNLGLNYLFIPKEDFFRKVVCLLYLSILKHFTNIIRTDHEIKDCIHLGKFLFVPKRQFWGKLTNANFVYILCPIMLRFKKILRADQNVSLHDFGSNWTKLSFCPKKGFICKIDWYFFLPVMPHPAATFQKHS